MDLDHEHAAVEESQQPATITMSVYEFHLNNARIAKRVSKLIGWMAILTFFIGLLLGATIVQSWHNSHTLRVKLVPQPQPTEKADGQT